MPSRRNDHEQPADAIAMLKADHQRVKDLFAQYEGTSNAEAKWTLAEEVFVELETHAQLEENIFYPSVNEETEEGLALVKESLQEHAAVTDLSPRFWIKANNFQELFAFLLYCVATIKFIYIALLP